MWAMEQSAVSHDVENTACPRQPKFSQNIYLFSLGDFGQLLRFNTFFYAPSYTVMCLDFYTGHFRLENNLKMLISEN
jgi:hypothetical protein